MNQVRFLEGGPRMTKRAGEDAPDAWVRCHFKPSRPTKCRTASPVCRHIALKLSRSLNNRQRVFRGVRRQIGDAGRLWTYTRGFDSLRSPPSTFCQYGELPERLIGAVLKTDGPKGHGGSNPSLSAKYIAPVNGSNSTGKYTIAFDTVKDQTVRWRGGILQLHKYLYGPKLQILYQQSTRY